ncbi:hypothetical protein AB9P05_04840 [Roseivirga sp. BDSF3-8]|uniref:hypothetical protein n=1 Tax=Roseivirga sp. BDSF3-8 TaxID=3241598 RepID=UPI003532798F
MDYLMEDIILLLMGAALLLVIFANVLVISRVNRMTNVCHHKLNEALVALNVMQVPYDNRYIQQVIFQSKRQNRRQIAHQVEDRIIKRFENLILLLGGIFEELSPENTKSHQYFSDLVDEVDRGGKVSRLLKSCLASDTFIKYGISGVLDIFCVSMMQKDFDDLAFTCNDKERRLMLELEEELIVIYLLIFIYYAFDRTPSAISMDLFFGDEEVTFTIEDNDPDSTDGLSLQYSSLDHWPDALEQAYTFARLYGGMAGADPAFSSGLRYRIVVPYQPVKRISESGY